MDAVESVDEWLSHGALLYRQHALNWKGSALHDFRRQFHARFESPQTLAQFLKCVALHVRALAAIAVFIGNEMEALVRRKFL